MMNVAKTVSLVKNPQLEGNSLKVGDFVFVRVLKTLNNNKALISFAGQTFEASIEDKNQLLSKNPSGMINGGFRAKILQKGDSILLQLQETSENFENQNINKNTLQFYTNQSDIKNYLQNLGLIPDSISYKIVQYIQQMGYSLNLKKIDDIRKIILQFPGQEKKASEVAMYLEEKGIPVTKENIQDFLNKIKGLTDFDNNFLAKNNNSSTKEKFWISIPFQYDVKNVKSHGTIFLLKDSHTEKINFISLRLYSEEKNIFFKIYLKNHYNQGRIDITKILFYITPLESVQKVSSLEQELRKLFLQKNENYEINSDSKVIFSQDAETSLFFSDDLGLIKVNANV